MGERVLVVEDDVDLCDAIQLLLESYGYDVVVAHDGAEALAAVEHAMPALILLDMFMPIMDGWMFARELHARHGPEAAPLLVLTAAERPRERAAEVGASAVLPKPFDMNTLLARVGQLVAPPVHGRVP